LYVSYAIKVEWKPRVLILTQEKTVEDTLFTYKVFFQFLDKISVTFVRH